MGASYILEPVSVFQRAHVGQESPGKRVSYFMTWMGKDVVSKKTLESSVLLREKTYIGLDSSPGTTHIGGVVSAWRR